MDITFFAEPSAWREWLEQHHKTDQELWVGFYKKASGKPSITWPQAVDEALCYGWIDGIRKSVDDISYKIRFTPRKSGSTWSAVNIKRVGELSELGLMQEAGRQAFAKKKENKSAIYAYEQRPAQLDEKYEAQLKANPRAWTFFHSQPPSYRKTAIWWVISAKQEATRLKRLNTLIQDSETGLRVAHLRRSR